MFTVSQGLHPKLPADATSVLKACFPANPQRWVVAIRAPFCPLNIRKARNPQLNKSHYVCDNGYLLHDETNISNT
jgi:hypothetical protein